MSYNNGIISTPINVSDPYYVMGVGQYNGWWDLGYICSNEHKKINPAAKYKPVRARSIWHTNENWYKGEAQTCGVYIQILYFPSSSMDPTPYQRWEYSDVRPNAGHWFRLADYEGYNHYATFPFITTIGDVNANGFVCTLIKNLNINGSRDDMLNISDMSILDINQRRITLDKLYFAVIIRETGGSQETYKWITTPRPIGDNKSNDTEEITLKVPTGTVSPEVKYDIFLCLTTIQSSNAMTWFYQYNDIFHVNYELNGFLNLGYKLNIYPGMTEFPKLISIAWLGFSSSESGQVINAQAEGMQFFFENNSIFLELVESLWKVELWGDKLTDGTEEFIYTVTKPINTSSAIDRQYVYFYINSHGYVNASISQYIGNRWIERLTQQLYV